MGMLFGGGGGGSSTHSTGPDRKNAPGSVDVSKQSALFRQTSNKRRGRLSSILASGLSLTGRGALGQ